MQISCYARVQRPSVVMELAKELGFLPAPKQPLSASVELPCYGMLEDPVLVLCLQRATWSAHTWLGLEPDSRGVILPFSKSNKPFAL
jgi:hypothetical protein